MIELPKEDVQKIVEIFDRDKTWRKGKPVTHAPTNASQAAHDRHFLLLIISKLIKYEDKTK